MRFVDIAGLVKGASKGEGLGNQFLSHIRETDAIVHVVRCFEDEEIIHVEGKLHPISDIETINLELILADLQSTQNNISRLEKQIKSKKDLLPTFQALEKAAVHLDKGLPLRRLQLSPEERSLLKPYCFLSEKKVIYAANVSEADLPSMENQYVQQVREYATQEGNRVVPIAAN